MPNARLIKFDYCQLYYKIKRKRTEYQLFDIEYLIDAINEKQLSRKAIDVYTGCKVRIEKFDYDSHNNLWLLRILRLRDDNLSFLVKPDEEAKPIELGDDEYLGEDMTMLFDISNNVAMIQRNRYALGFKNLQKTMQKIIGNEDLSIDIRPITKIVNIKSIQRDYFKSIEIRFANIRGKDAVDGYANGLTDNAEIAEDSVTNFIDGVMEAIAKAQDSHSPSKVTEGLAKDAVDGYNLGISENTESTINIVTKYAENVLSRFSTLADSFRQIGKNAMEGLFNGLASMESTLYDKTEEIANNITETVKTTLDIHSPSRVMFALGEYTMEGYQLGVESMYSAIEKSMGGFSSGLPDEITSTPQLSYADIPSSVFSTTEYNSYSYYDSHNSFDVSETNMLLRELLSVTRAGHVIEYNGRELGKTIRDEDREYYNRTGRGMFQH